MPLDVPESRSLKFISAFSSINFPTFSLISAGEIP
jgi:hypothetical protein